MMFDLGLPSTEQFQKVDKNTTTLITLSTLHGTRCWTSITFTIFEMTVTYNECFFLLICLALVLSF